MGMLRRSEDAKLIINAGKHRGMGTMRRARAWTREVGAARKRLVKQIQHLFKAGKKRARTRLMSRASTKIRVRAQARAQARAQTTKN